MSAESPVRRKDKVMADERAWEVLAPGFCGRLATTGPDGYPYCVPLLYVCLDGEVLVHNTSARGHLRANVDHEARVCFEVDEPGEVFAYGRFECDTSIAYRSVVLFGRIRVVDDAAAKQRFFAALMEKYGRPEWARPAAFFPRLGETTVYAIAVERLTGKETPLPVAADRCPAADHTRTPNARPPRE